MSQRVMLQAKKTQTTQNQKKITDFTENFVPKWNVLPE